ncbi:hypothetical protein ICMP_146 [Candidatus Ishikawaella capsulata Mpkobe]|uniref:Uncharacterized protein n=1 Tax=Candidatus Ishikawaella capsulata Mpkobe TaxID=476281 RepID=C5WCF1_9ENTR|nr:hypothetical protein ICMP_146 [Candidatus Ishikawaella capsulata Mpkobe]
MQKCRYNISIFNQLPHDIPPFLYSNRGIDDFSQLQYSTQYLLQYFQLKGIDKLLN